MNLLSIASMLPSASNDARRFALFFAACQAKAVQLVKQDPAALIPFGEASAKLAQEWVDAPRKISLKNFRDPYKPAREKARRFAAEWDLDETFRKELG